MADFRPLPPALQWPTVKLVPSETAPHILVPEGIRQEVMDDVEEFMEEYSDAFTALAKL